MSPFKIYWRRLRHAERMEQRKNLQPYYFNDVEKAYPHSLCRDEPSSQTSRLPTTIPVNATQKSSDGCLGVVLAVLISFLVRCFSRRYSGGDEGRRFDDDAAIFTAIMANPIMTPLQIAHTRDNDGAYHGMMEIPKTVKTYPISVVDRSSQNSLADRQPITNTTTHPNALNKAKVAPAPDDIIAVEPQSRYPVPVLPLAARIHHGAARSVFVVDHAAENTIEGDKVTTAGKRCVLSTVGVRIVDGSECTRLCAVGGVPTDLQKPAILTIKWARKQHKPSRARRQFPVSLEVLKSIEEEPTHMPTAETIVGLNGVGAVADAAPSELTVALAESAQVQVEVPAGRNCSLANITLLGMDGRGITGLEEFAGNQNRFLGVPTWDREDSRWDPPESSSGRNGCVVNMALREMSDVEHRGDGLYALVGDHSTTVAIGAAEGSMEELVQLSPAWSSSVADGSPLEMSDGDSTTGDEDELEGDTFPLGELEMANSAAATLSPVVVSSSSVGQPVGTQIAVVSVLHIITKWRDPEDWAVIEGEWERENCYVDGG